MSESESHAVEKLEEGRRLFNVKKPSRVLAQASLLTEQEERDVYNLVQSVVDRLLNKEMKHAFIAMTAAKLDMSVYYKEPERDQDAIKRKETRLSRRQASESSGVGMEAGPSQAHMHNESSLLQDYGLNDTGGSLLEASGSSDTPTEKFHDLPKKEHDGLSPIQEESSLEKAEKTGGSLPSLSASSETKSYSKPCSTDSDLSSSSSVEDVSSLPPITPTSSLIQTVDSMVGHLEKGDNKGRSPEAWQQMTNSSPTHSASAFATSCSDRNVTSFTSKNSRKRGDQVVRYSWEENRGQLIAPPRQESDMATSSNHLTPLCIVLGQRRIKISGTLPPIFHFQSGDFQIDIDRLDL